MATEYTYKFRLYPNKEQKRFLNKQFGCCRFVYNKILEIAQKEYKEAGKQWNCYEYTKKLPQLKQEYAFLTEVNAQSLQGSVRNLDKAFKNFFEKRAGFPKFKSKRYTETVHIPQSFKIQRTAEKKGLLKIPKLKTPIRVKMHRAVKGEVRSISITKTPDSKYYVNILVRKAIKPLKLKGKVAAIDVGIEKFAVIHDGQSTIHIENPKHLQKSESKLKKLQRRLSKKQKASKNREKTRLKVAKQHQKIANQRRDFLHKVSAVITKQFDTVVVESLNIKGLMKNEKLSKQIADVSWYELMRQLEYKARWYGRELIKADRFYASSKQCNVCEYKNDQLTLAMRKWQCPKCKTTHDRDENASKNLYNYGVAHLTSGRARSARTQACGAGSVGGTQGDLRSTRHPVMK